jgi:ribosomal protein S27AE
VKPRGRLKRRKGLARLSRSRRASLELYRVWAAAVKYRDRRCQWPRCDVGVLLEAHHVYPKGHYPALRTSLENGLALCPVHHREWHSASRKWRGWWAERWPDRAVALGVLLAR